MQNSEFRRDPVSRDWVVIAPKRTHSLEQFSRKEKRTRAPKATCPFENPQKNGNDEPMLAYTDEKGEWIIQVIPNKYPIVEHQAVCAVKFEKGPYQMMEGIGYHDLVITRDHNANFANLTPFMASLVFATFKERYVTMMQDTCMKYVSVFHNWGPSAGASMYHPHYQILSLPIIPPDVHRSLRGSYTYFEKTGSCVHCAMLNFERKAKKRIVYENKEAIVFAPFVSREPFELRVFPKKHLPYFEETNERVMDFVVDALQRALRILEKQLNDPDYNFFIHTAPLQDKEKYNHYHWHIEVQPKVRIIGGFELGTGIEVNVVDPDSAVAMLRGNKTKAEATQKENKKK
ncbi:MAG: hypothetical protein ACD_81C00067G0007 [uncultured bacterium]|uniref:Galactose-1-phosphate uridylyltransferase n=2 Tax=Candidatus Wolfeibacteriota TaxID=1752735 RepID=A0A0G1JFU2_9BACT|nr:MAG: hypothetical protein ACD_81C00067G0007 [uncultured bacterium]KKR12078.1 MAG: Galactose-1-phosphate uridylyltransferase [Candidatus Wolfebacteria bacterium GW2011_GWC2_39_22]KKT42902.1 MAG: Galactose-1-phosphate uridylyltransferase [Candidatus Wolfebacteria bacterium GW2011_GWE2_44_13]HBI25317.1 hypothetical protein [Candidatus Wolfebacteria bacterium]